MSFCSYYDYAKTKTQISLAISTKQRPCIRYTDSTIPLPPKSEISSLMTSSVAVQLCLCRTWSETQKTGFLMTGLISGKLFNSARRCRHDSCSSVYTYFKRGNYRDAIKDFKKLKPSNVVKEDRES